MEKGLGEREMAKYIKCNHCGKRINFGDIAYHFDYTDVYCSAECYCEGNANAGTVDDYFATECDCTVYDDEARIAEIRKEMEECRTAMEKLYNEFHSLTTQN